ncbi:peptidyl-alpha-hydroxyglycine alpha-amidating lyase 1-like, partial [Augochlora pura]
FLQHRDLHLPDGQFGSNEYYEDAETGDRDKGSLVPQLGLTSNKGYASQSSTESVLDLSDTIDKNIVWDSQWAHNLKFGQISAVSVDPRGNIGVFHRGSRVWDAESFDMKDRYMQQNNGPIPEDTLLLLDKSGNKLLEWGRHIFYLPHGLTIDSYGNYWITDVALHQVFKFDADEILMMEKVENLRKRQNDSMMPKVIPSPSLILGVAFTPGNDDKHFCKPTAIAVQNNGDFFVSDGYCNSRIIKFNAKGERILQWGRNWGGEGSMNMLTPPPYAFLVPHALALATEFNLIFVADRENGRVLSFSASNGTFHKEYKHPTIGTKIYSVAYAKEKLYLINGPDIRHKWPIRGFVLDMHSGDLLSQFGPNYNMNRPHDIAVTEDGSEIYVVELDMHRIYRFLQGKYVFFLQYFVRTLATMLPS